MAAEHEIQLAGADRASRARRRRKPRSPTSCASRPSTRATATTALTSRINARPARSGRDRRRDSRAPRITPTSATRKATACSTSRPACFAARGISVASRPRVPTPAESLQRCCRSSRWQRRRVERAQRAACRARHADRLRRHRQGIRGRPRRDDPARPRDAPRLRQPGRRRSRHRPAAGRHAVARRASGIRERPSLPIASVDRRGRSDCHERRLRALFRSGRQALLPHPRLRSRACP